jgi:pimeloyl-ACP methyl ester carboxylesterase
VGVHSLVPVPHDQSLHVYHAPADQRRAIVYLHGVCGNVHAVRSWVDAALAFGTLIELVAESPCANRPGRFAALAAVKALRGGLLDTDQVVLFGYSQGAARVEALAHENPGRFAHVVLGSPPEKPDPKLLGACESVVVLGGTEEDTRHLQTGVLALQADGIRARYLFLPGAAHGEYGPRARDVVQQALLWLLDPPTE